MMSSSFEDSYYYKSSEFKANLAGLNVSFSSKPGLPDWKVVTTADRLVSEKIFLPGKKKVCFLGSRNGIAPAAHMLNNPDLEISIIENNHIAVEESRKTFRLNNLPEYEINFQISFLPEKSNFFDYVILFQQKSRQLMRRYLVEAYQILKDSGDFYLVGANNLGIRSTISDLNELTGNYSIVAFKKGNRLAKSIKVHPANPFPNWFYEPGILPGSWHTFNTILLGKEIKFYTLPGVFSADNIDPGTDLLITQIPDLTGSDILDFGCGYGVVGIAAALRNAMHIDMIDSNLHAICSSLKNTASLSLNNITIITGDGLREVSDKKYHLILTNPPFHVERDIDYSITQAFLAGCKNLLYSRGSVLLVANRFIPYNRWMNTIFKTVKCLAADTKFNVWIATDDL